MGTGHIYTAARYHSIGFLGEREKVNYENILLMSRGGKGVEMLKKRANSQLTQLFCL